MCLSLSACSSLHKNLEPTLQVIDNESLIPVLLDNTDSFLFRSQVKIGKHQFSGLMLIKKLNKTTERIVFTSPMGQRLLDVSLEKEKFAINYSLKALNKKSLLKLLESDLRLLLRLPISKKTSFLQDTDTQTLVSKRITSSGCDFYFMEKGILRKLQHMNRFGKLKTRFKFEKHIETLPNLISIRHYGFIPLEIELELLKK